MAGSSPHGGGEEEVGQSKGDRKGGPIAGYSGPGWSDRAVSIMGQCARSQPSTLSCTPEPKSPRWQQGSTVQSGSAAARSRACARTHARTCLEDPLQVPVQFSLNLLLPAELQEGAAVLDSLPLLGKLSTPCGKENKQLQ